MAPAGPLTELPFIYQTLEDVKSQTIIINGLHCRSAEAPPGQSPADHWVASAFMSAQKPKRTAGADVYNGTTIDQIIAQKIGQDTLMPSMQLAVEDPGANSSNCGEGYSCAYTNSISWSTPVDAAADGTEPAGHLRAHVRRRQHGGGAGRAPRTGSQHPRFARRQPVAAAAPTSARQTAPGSTSTRRTCARSSGGSRLPGRRRPTRRRKAPCRLACRSRSTSTSSCSSTCWRWRSGATLRASARCCTPATSRRGTSRRAASTVGFHGGSHHGEDPKRMDEYSKMNRYHVAMLAHFVEKLAKTQDGDGTILDHSLVLYGTNMGNSNQHRHEDSPHVLVGGASGKLKGGRALFYPTKTVPTGNLLVSLLEQFDIHQDSIGDSTGRLEDL